MIKVNKIFIVIFAFFVIVGCQEEQNSGLNNSTKLLKKLMPQKITFPTGSNGDVQAEIDLAWNLFDRNTGSSYFTESIKFIELHLASTEEIGSVRIFGDPDNILNIKSKGNEISFEKQNDTSEENAWHSLVFSGSIKAKSLIIETLGNIGEFEVWGYDTNSDMRSVFNKNDFVTLHFLPSNFTVSKGSTASVNLNITMNPCIFKRAFLKYESDQYLPVSIARQINGYSMAGGLSVRNDDKIIRNHSEEINPEWLIRGKNTIEFKSEDSDFTMKNIRIEFHGDDGWNSVSSVSETDLFDRDINTSEKISISQGDILIHFDRKVAPYELKFFLPEAQQVKGQLSVCNNGQWGYVRDFEIDFSGMEKGWNSIIVPEGTTSESLKIDFSSKNKTFLMNEILVSASPVGMDVPRIVVSYPKKGEFFGRTAYIQGFVTSMQEVSNITIEGIKDSRNSSDGSFSIALSKDQTRFSSQKDNAPWDPVIRASVQGNILKHELNLYSNYSEDYNDTNPIEETEDEISDDVVGPDGTFRTTLDPNMSKNISFQNVRMNIPAGAVDKVTEITITPLKRSDLKNLDPGMMNVTFPAAGYRFLPHGKFKKPIEIYFHYARELLKRGQKDDDIFMHYYDEEAKKWKRLDRLDVVKDVQLVRSVTDHFTDIVNATLTVPEHPNPLSYNPNSIKNLKSASPATGINMIAPPVATNMGDANMSYPIVVPKGRNGMQPNFAVQYSSEGGNSMMGQGWNISMHSITINTKFGVPRYNGDEVYLLNGMKLVPDPEKSGFYRLKAEGAFNLIQRVGTRADNYSWVITNKKGTKLYYGITSSARLSNPRSDNNNIFQWCLEKVIDVHGNNVKYYYRIDTAPGAEPGRGIYLDRATYTGTGNLDGLYSVYFTYDDDRPDMIVNCRSGFKMVTRLKLTSVDVVFEDVRVRRYEYKYKTGAFNKLLLMEIQTYGEVGSNGVGYFYKHDFEYYDEIGYDPVGNNKSLNGFSSSGSGYNKGKRLFNYNSDLGSNIGGGATVDVFSGYSPPIIGGRKDTSVGVRIGSGFDMKRGKFDLADVNGDGLVDRMGKDSYVLNTTSHDLSSVTWGEKIPISNLGPSLDDNKSWSVTVGGSAYLFGFGMFSDYNTGGTISDRYLMDMNADYRVDIVSGSNVKFNNAQIADGKEVKAKFEDISAMPIGINNISADITDEPDDAEWQTDQSDWESVVEEENLSEKYYRDDPIRMWQAPYDGFVQISGNVSLFTERMENEIQFEEDIKKTIDGVVVSIQKGKNVLWFRELSPSFEKIENGTTVTYKPKRKIVTPQNVDGVHVNKGDRIYFRVNSIYDGSYDVVEWDPVIEYVNIDTALEDENGFNLYRFKASEDFSLMVTDINIDASHDGIIGISGDVFKKKITTDDILVKIKISTPEIDGNGSPTGKMLSINEVYKKKIEWNESDESSPVLSVNLNDISVKKGDVIKCELFADSTVDWRQISWKPVVSYKRIKNEKQNYELDPKTGEVVVDENGNPIITTIVEEVDVDDLFDISDGSLPDGYDADSHGGKQSMDFFAPVAMSHYPIIDEGPVRSLEVSGDYVGNSSLDYTVMLFKEEDPFGGVVSNIENMPRGYEASLSFAVKRKNILTGKNELLVKNNCIIRNGANGPEIVGVDSDSNETAFIENQVNFTLDLAGVNEGDRLYFVYTSKSSELLKYISFSDPEIVNIDSGNSVKVKAVFCRNMNDAEEALLYGGGFRNWYYGRWNGEGKTDGEDKLNPEMMVMSECELTEGPELSEEKIEEIISGVNTEGYAEVTGEISAISRLKTFSPMITDSNYFWMSDSVNRNLKKWQKKGPSQIDGNNVPDNMPVYVGNDGDTWISATMMSSTRLINKNLNALASELGGMENSTVSNESSVEIGHVSHGRNRGIKRSTKHSGFVVGLDAYGSGNISKNSMKTNADMFDFNGDLYPDVVKNGHVRFTNSDGSLGEVKRMEGFSYVRESESSNYTLGISLGVDGSIQKTSYMANGNVVGQKADFSTPGISLFAGFGTTKSKNDFIDINGDGLPDRVNKDGSVQLNLGYRLGARESIIPGTLTVNKTANVNSGGSIGFSSDKGGWGGGLFINSSQSGVESTYIDINGDGLPDRVEKSLHAVPGVGIIPKNNKLKVSFNTGKGFTQEYYWEGGSGNLPLTSDMSINVNTGGNFSINIPLFALFIPLGYIIINPGAGADVSYGKVEVRMMDINGDGYADHVYADSSGKVKANFNKTGRTNLLKKVKRPLGGWFELAYKRQGNTVDMPHSKWVVETVTIHDGMPVDGGVHSYISKYEYDGGFYDRVEREFYGFRILTERTGQGTESKEVVRTFLNKKYCERGLEERLVVKDHEGNIYSKNKNVYDYRPICEGSTFVYINRKYNYLYEGTTTDENAAAPKSTFLEFQYDSYGNVDEFSDYGEPGIVTDDVTARISYDFRPSLYIMSKTNLIRVSGYDGTILRVREGTYDARGNLREQRQYLDGINYSVTNMDYNSNGTVNTVISPCNERGQRYYKKYYYDSKVKTYVVRTDDAFGLFSSTKYDLRYGHPLSTVDTNSNLILYSYDKFGRATSVWAPYDIGTSKPTVEYVYNHISRPAYARTFNKEYSRSLKTIDKVIFVDGLGRTVQTQKTHEVNGKPGRIVSGKVFFDSLGRLVSLGHPGFAGDLTFSYINSAPLNPTSFVMDVLNRKLKTNHPDGTDDSSDYGFRTDGGVTLFSTIRTDRNGERKETLKNIRGLIQKMIEYNREGENIETSYKYNAMREIVKVTDHAGNMTFADYDMAGRRTSISNPDTGNLSMQYDAASNLIRKTTPNLRENGQSLRYTYFYKRLIKINYPNMPDVTYVYGKPGEAWNRAGRITSVDNGTMKEDFYYGQLGETLKSTRSIKSSKGTVAFTTRFEWDNLAKMRKLFYPDGEVLHYEYNSAGLLKSAIGWKNRKSFTYVKEILYDEFEKRKNVTLGNNVTTTYTYDPLNRRLENLNTKGDDGKVFQNITYKFDYVGNIIERSNNGFTINDTEVKKSTQTYKYDSFHRLTDSEGSYNHERWIPIFDKRVNSYTNSFSYDSIGNILNKKQKNTGLFPDTGETVTIEKTTYDNAYQYDSFRPHAVTEAGPKTFEYDANGNMTRMRDSSNGLNRQLAWDDENRLTKTDDSFAEIGESSENNPENESGNLTTYSYDSGGNRVKKNGKHGEVIYVNNNYTIRNGSVVGKHVFAGDTRVASKLVVTESPEEGTETGEIESGEITPGGSDEGIYYYHGDHLGSSSVVTNKEGKFHEHVEYFPFGETWVHEKASDNAVSMRYKFTGKEMDPETGLYYYGARYYDPVVSKWISVDPILNDYLPSTGNNKMPAGGIFRSSNLGMYSYVGNRPVNYKDPTGKYDVDVHFYLTQYLAVKAGFSGTDATAMGIACNEVDYDPKSRPMRWGIFGYLFPKPGALKGWHFPIKGIFGKTKHNSPAARKKIEAEINNAGRGSGSIENFGKAMHVLQDSYSHEGFGIFFGHLFHKHEPDKSYKNPAKSMAMAKTSYLAMLDYLKASGRKDVKNEWSSISQGVSKKMDYFSRKYNVDDKRSQTGKRGKKR